MPSYPRGARVAFGVAAACLVLYPVLRPWSPEADPHTFAQARWPVSHALGMAGFVALAVGLRALAADEPPGWSGQPVRRAESRAWLAVAGLLPYYGAEAFGLAAVGANALAYPGVDAAGIAADFRYAPLPVTVFALGLIALALVGGRLIHGFWRMGTQLRTGGLLAGVGLLSYLPQFFGGMPVRIGHALVLGLGLALLATARPRGSVLATPGPTPARTQSRSRM